MSALGHKRTLEPTSRMSALPPRADMRPTVGGPRTMKAPVLGEDRRPLIATVPGGRAFSARDGGEWRS